MHDSRAYLLALVVERSSRELNKMAISSRHLEHVAHALRYNEVQFTPRETVPDYETGESPTRYRSTWPGYQPPKVTPKSASRRRVSPRETAATPAWPIDMAFDGDVITANTGGRAPAPWAIPLLLLRSALWLQLLRLATERAEFADVVGAKEFAGAEQDLLRALRWRYDLRWMFPRPKPWRSGLPKAVSPALRAGETDQKKGSWWLLCQEAAARLGFRPKTTVQVYVREAKAALPGEFDAARNRA